MRAIIKDSELNALCELASNYRLRYTFTRINKEELEITLRQDDGDGIPPNFAFLLGRDFQVHIDSAKTLPILEKLLVESIKN